jgi:periplasmic protein TonB
MAGEMFHTLEATWDQSARRGWTAMASFSMQALALSLLLLVPLITIQGPPRIAWFDPHLLAPPPPPPAPAPLRPSSGIRGSEMRGTHLWQPPSIPDRIVSIDDQGVAPAPDISGIGVDGGTGLRGTGVISSIGEPAISPPAPTPPASTAPLRISRWAEGNLIYRVEPRYPTLARQARIQGTVQLRAIISKTGTIENLTVLSGHAMLVTAAVEAVRQWRYRPYLLNGEPIAVDTDITVNFMLAGN